MTELYFNGIKLDLYGDEKIVTTQGVNSFDSLETRQGVYSNTFRIPPTTVNIAAIECSHILTSTSNVPYRKGDSRLVSGGVDFFGTGVVQSFKNDFELVFFGGNTDFWIEIKGKKLSDLHLSELDHAWTRDNIIASQSNTSGYIYPVIDYHNDSPNIYINTYEAKVDSRTIFPAVFANTYVPKIFSEAGFSAVGFENIPNYSNLIIPYVNAFDNEGNVFILNRQLGARTAANYEDDPAEQAVVFAEIDNDPINLITSNTFITLGSSSFEGTIEFVFTAINAGASTERLIIYEDDGNVANKIELADYPIPPGFTLIEHTKTIEWVLGKRYWVAVENIAASIINVQGGMLMYPSGFGKSWLYTDFVPDMLQSDLIKSLMLMFCLTPVTGNREMTVTPFAEIAANKLNAYDWSNKIDESEEPEIRYRTRFAQKNNCRYTFDPTELIEFLGDDSFLIDDENLPIEGDVIKLPFAYTRNWDRIQSKQVGRIRMLIDGAPELKPKPRILRLWRENITFTYFEANTGESDTSAVMTYANSIGLSWDELLTAHYSEVIDTLNQFKEIELPVRLTHAEVQQFDYTRPVYIEKYSSYFFLQEFIQHDHTSNNSTLVRLLQLK